MSRPGRPRDGRGSPGRRRLARGLAVAAVATAVLFVRSSLKGLAGGGEAREARIALLGALRAAYPAALGTVILAVAALATIAVAIARRRRRNLPVAFWRGAILGASATVAIVLVEGTAAAYLAWLHRMPPLPEVRRGQGPRPAGKDVQIVVVGESSAEGVPYRDWLSVGKVVAWQLRRAVPWRMFHVEVQARPGWTLEPMHQRLVESRSRPDLVIVYAGHNEFASRFGWSSDVPYYLDEPPSWPSAVVGWIARVSPTARLVGELHDRELVAAPPRRRERRLVDVPSQTPAQRAERLADFRRRLEAIVAYCDRVGALPVLVIPPGNDAGFEPNRSVLPPETPRAGREAFARDFERARSADDFRALVARQPGFAESHFRLARLLEASGDAEAAHRHYVEARDLDGHPMRCPTPLQDAYREVAARRGAVLIDGPAVLRARHPRGLLDDTLFNDAMHPSFEGHVALAEAVLAGLKGRGAFGWPEETPAPRIDRAECAEHFDVRVAAWASACEFAASFYRTTAPIRFDPAERRAKAASYGEALRRLDSSRSADGLGLAGIGLDPTGGRARR